MSSLMREVVGVECDAAEWALRVDLAAAFRLAVEFDWHESVANHFSAAVSEDGNVFLLNPKWRHFSTIKASDLLKVDFGDKETMSRENARVLRGGLLSPSL